MLQKYPQSIEECFTLRDWGYVVLNTSDADEKAQLTLQAVKLWQDKSLTQIGQLYQVDTPKRPQNVKICLPKDMPRRNKSKDGKSAMIHALVHVENIAIELSWDILMRFDETKYNLPVQFFDDWVRIAGEEAKHYSILKKRLEIGYGKTYGDYPAHGNLWNDALDTKDDLLKRLVLEHCIHEARGLDVTLLKTIPNFEQGDQETAEILKNVIIPDEITHVRDGLKWFKHVCQNTLDLNTEQQFINEFHKYVKLVMKYDNLIGPFHIEAREKAGLTLPYYEPFMNEKDK